MSILATAPALQDGKSAAIFTLAFLVIVFLLVAFFWSRKK